jgi:hypothetical protein
MILLSLLFLKKGVLTVRISTHKSTGDNIQEIVFDAASSDIRSFENSIQNTSKVL